MTADGRSLYWAGLSRGKSAVVTDLRSDEGQRFVHGLLSDRGDRTGILVTNVSGQHWLSDEVLRALRPDLIHVRVLGRRDGGSAVDYTVNAATGLPSATGVDGREPTNHAIPAWDLLCSYAALAALARRRDAREGRYSTGSLEDVAVCTVTTVGFVPDAQLTVTSRVSAGRRAVWRLRHRWRCVPAIR